VQAADVPCFPQLVENIIYSGHWVGILFRLGVDLPEVDAQSPVFFSTITMGELYELF